LAGLRRPSKQERLTRHGHPDFAAVCKWDDLRIVAFRWSSQLLAKLPLLLIAPTYVFRTVALHGRWRRNVVPPTDNITIPPDAYTFIDPAATPVLTVERGNHRATYATFSANFAIRTFASEAEDRHRTDAEKLKRTTVRNYCYPATRIAP
jgi:hypothetical protein